MERPPLIGDFVEVTSEIFGAQRGLRGFVKDVNLRYNTQGDWVRIICYKPQNPDHELLRPRGEYTNVYRPKHLTRIEKGEGFKDEDFPDVFV